MKKSVALFVLAILPALSCVRQNTLVVDMLPEETWWGGFDNPNSWQIKGDYSFPFDASMEFEVDFSANNYSNNIVPMFVSSKGRYIWSDAPFVAKFQKGKIRIEGTAPVSLTVAGNTLREAFLAASRTHFPPKGIIPPEEFISRPQYNTWIELMYNQNQDDILKYANDIVSNGFPDGAVFMVDDNWQKYYGNFEFKPDRFPDPKAMMDRLHDMGFKVMFWVCPYISPDSPEYRELASKGYLVMDAKEDKPAIYGWWNGFSAILDMSNPKAKEWLISRLCKMQELYGVDGFKFDAGDAAPYDIKNVKVFDGKSYGPLHTELWCTLAEYFPYNEYRASWKMAGTPTVMRLCDKVYSWDAVGMLIPGMLASAMEGHVFVCPDMIGGGEFQSFLNIDPKSFDQALIVRSCQIHAMMPMMQFSVAPWRILSEDNLELCRQAAWKHVELAPYLLEQAKKSVISGEPIIRPMEYAFPGEGFETCCDQYMLGDRYLVAPMMQPGDVRTIKLPSGLWQDETGRRYEGGRIYEINVPLSRIPYFTQL